MESAGIFMPGICIPGMACPRGTDACGAFGFEVGFDRAGADVFVEALVDAREERLTAAFFFARRGDTASFVIFMPLDIGMPCIDESCGMRMALSMGMRIGAIVESCASLCIVES